MCLKIRCDGESEKFCKIFWELNNAEGLLPVCGRRGRASLAIDARCALRAAPVSVDCRSRL